MTLNVGDILTLPFHAGDEPSEHDLQYEVEKLGVPSWDGSPGASLIMLRDGKREKTPRGHFRRCTRTLWEVRLDLDARRVRS